MMDRLQTKVLVNTQPWAALQSLPAEVPSPSPAPTAAQRPPGGPAPRVSAGAPRETAAGGRPHTYLDGGLPAQEELQALGVVGQAAVVQGRAALPRLLVQVPAGRAGEERERTVSHSRRTRLPGPGTEA